MIERPEELEFRAGQFVSLIRPDDGLTRSYSIASLPTESAIELQIALLPGGRMGKYLSETPHAPLTLRQAAGECFYLDHKKDEALLLAGTGTGLAPLLGIVRSALQAKHRGPITLFHGAKDRAGLYFREELRALSQEHEHFSYEENVLPPPASSPPPSKAEAPAPDLLAQVKRALPKLDGYRVYLCGNPDFVHKMKKQCFLAGAAMQAIHSDPFVLASSSSAPKL
jgi:ferredoxin-NADP reductase